MQFTKSFVKFCNTWELSIPRIKTCLLKGMKPGKVLQREMFLCNPGYKHPDRRAWVDTSIQAALHSLKADQYAKEVCFAYSYEKILEVYLDQNCPSCMSDEWAAEVAAQFYSDNMFVIAYRHDGEKVTSRTVTFGKKCTKFYGPESMKLRAGLEELDYTPTEESLLPFWCSYEIPYHNGRFYIPYLDCASGCFIPYAGRHNPVKNTWQCLYVPFSMEYEEFISEDDMEEFARLKESIELGKYLDRFLNGKPHGESCEHQGALHYLDRLLGSELKVLWDMKSVNGRIFWVQHYQDEYGVWEKDEFFMDDYGNAIDRPYESEYGDIHREISLGRWGHF